MKGSNVMELVMIAAGFFAVGYAASVVLDEDEALKPEGSAKFGPVGELPAEHGPLEEGWFRNSEYDPCDGEPICVFEIDGDPWVRVANLETGDTRCVREGGPPVRRRYMDFGPPPDKGSGGRHGE